jgi:hypothetical protein
MEKIMWKVTMVRMNETPTLRGYRRKVEKAGDEKLWRF